jgi:hypothetical protein
MEEVQCRAWELHSAQGLPGLRIIHLRFRILCASVSEAINQIGDGAFTGNLDMQWVGA